MSKSQKDIEVIAPNLNRRLSGVTATIVRLVPIQAKAIRITSFGVGLPEGFPKLGLLELLSTGWGKDPIVWHARRNVEMLLGIVLKFLLFKKFKLLFTSASQRQHTGYTKFLINRMDRVVATSNAGASYLEHDADVVYHGINTTDFTPEADQAALKSRLGLPPEKLVGCFGRIRKQKGTDVFVDAMIEVLPHHPDWKAVILGRATEQYVSFQEDLKKKVVEAGLEDRILFSGEVPVDQIASWYQALSLFIAPQRWEGFGLTPLEAMACGVPVVATTVGAFPEIVLEGQTGHLINPGDVGEMTAAANKLMDDPKKLAGFATASRSHMVENFDISVEANRLVEIYREMLNS